jgi:hypothetical protein
MSASENKKALVFSILEFLQKSCEDGTINKDDTEGIEGKQRLCEKRNSECNRIEI